MAVPVWGDSQVGMTSRAQCRMDERACQPFASAGWAVTRAHIGGGCWDVMLRYRYRQSLRSDVKCARQPIVQSLDGGRQQGDVWALVVAGIGECWGSMLDGQDGPLAIP